MREIQEFSQVKIIKTLFAASVLAAFVCTAAETPSPEHVKWMKALGAQNGALRKGVDVAKNAHDMEVTMQEVSKFWHARHSEVADKANKSIVDGAKAIAAAGDNKEAMMAGMKMVGAGCKGCHDSHREKISDTEYKIK
jgi:cytochrome c556